MIKLIGKLWIFATLILLLLLTTAYIHKNLIKTANSETAPEKELFAFSGELYKPELIAQNDLIAPKLTQSDIIALIRSKALERGLNADLLISLAKCESGVRQFNDDGSVLRGKVHPYDVGIMQINLNPEKTDWANVAKMTGYDPYEIEGNIDLAMLIAELQGYKAWVCLGMI